MVGIKSPQGSEYQQQQVVSGCVRNREEAAILNFVCPLAQRFVKCTVGM